MLTIKHNHGTYTTKSYQVWVVGIGNRWKVIHHSGKNADCCEGDATTGVIQANMDYTEESHAESAAVAQCRRKSNSTGYKFKGFKNVPVKDNVTAAYDALRRVFGHNRGEELYNYFKDELEAAHAAATPAKESKPKKAPKEEGPSTATINQEWGSW